MSVNRTLCLFSKYTRSNNIQKLSSLGGGSGFYAQNTQFIRKITSSVTNYNQHKKKNVNNSESNLVHTTMQNRRNLAPQCHKKTYTTALSNMTRDQANELVFRLNDQERQLLYQVLTQFQTNSELKRNEGKCTCLLQYISYH